MNSNQDVQNKFNQLKNERNISYPLNNTFYNPITNIIPQKIESSKDLKLNITTNNINLKKILHDKELEREYQLKNNTFSKELYQNPVLDPNISTNAEAEFKLN